MFKIRFQCLTETSEQSNMTCFKTQGLYLSANCLPVDAHHSVVHLGSLCTHPGSLSHIYGSIYWSTLLKQRQEDLDQFLINNLSSTWFVDLGICLRCSQMSGELLCRCQNAPVLLRRLCDNYEKVCCTSFVNVFKTLEIGFHVSVTLERKSRTDSNTARRCGNSFINVVHHPAAS